MIKINDKTCDHENSYSLKNLKEVSFMSIDSSENLNFLVKKVSYLNENIIKSNQNINILSAYNEDFKPSNSDKDKDYILHWILNQQKLNRYV